MPAIALSSLPIELAGVSLPEEPVAAVGIDLGTTNSVLAVGHWTPADPTVISIACIEVEQPTAALGAHIGTLVPSIVARHGGQLFVGEGAKRLAAGAGASGLRRNRDFFFETKNEVGTDRRYPQAPENFRTPGEIAGCILRYLMAAARVEPSSTVVTVPASFQAAQRTETVAAAAHAGFDLLRTQLFDEPLAAFIDFLSGNPPEITVMPGTTCNLLVFDFGGGTCDIALLSLSRGAHRQGLEVAARSISRFHRLGGGDIDAAIVYDVLLPQLLRENQLAERAFGYTEKRNQLEPALRPIAEGLKTGLCQEQTRRARLGLPPDPALRRQFPGRHSVTVNGRALTLTNPVLTAEAFAAVLGPFLDRSMLAPRSDEYRTSRSIFAPVDDAIERSGLRNDEIDICLMVGGSAGIPQVVDALRTALPRSRVVGYEDPTARKECVARGAAIAAVVHAVTGRRILTPVCHEAIALRTQDGLREMVTRGQVLPWPADGEAELSGLLAPRGSEHGPLDLRVEVVAAGDERTLFKALWPLEPPVREGEKLAIRYRFDANQVMRLRLLRPERPDQPETQVRIENPLTNVQNPVLKEIEGNRGKTPGGRCVRQVGRGSG
jgi:molecular chaperone DnaK (HSP70)